MSVWLTRLIALMLISATVYVQYHHNVDLSNKLTITNNALTVANAQITANAIAQKNVADLDRKYTEQLSDAQNKIDKLRADVISGNKRLRIKASCVSGNTRTSRLGNATTVELSPITGQSVLDLRASIISDQAKIGYLQEYVRQANGYIQETDKKTN